LIEIGLVTCREDGFQKNGNRKNGRDIVGETKGLDSGLGLGLHVKLKMEADEKGNV
jgi:hypothetical protein